MPTTDKPALSAVEIKNKHGMHNFKSATERDNGNPKAVEIYGEQLCFYLRKNYDQDVWLEPGSHGEHLALHSMKEYAAQQTSILQKQLEDKTAECERLKAFVESVAEGTKSRYEYRIKSKELLTPKQYLKTRQICAILVMKKLGVRP